MKISLKKFVELNAMRIFVSQNSNDMKRKQYTPAMQNAADKAYNCELHGRKTNQPKLIELAKKAYEMIDEMWKANGEHWIED